MPVEFPVESLRPVRGKLSGDPSNATIEIELQPFQLGEGNLIASIVLEGVTLPTLEPSQLSATEHLFPTNPEDGYIEARCT